MALRERIVARWSHETALGRATAPASLAVYAQPESVSRKVGHSSRTCVGGQLRLSRVDKWSDHGSDAFRLTAGSPSAHLAAAAGGRGERHCCGRWLRQKRVSDMSGSGRQRSMR